MPYNPSLCYALHDYMERPIKREQVVVNYWSDSGVSTLVINNFTPEDSNPEKKEGQKKISGGFYPQKNTTIVLNYSHYSIQHECSLWWMTWIPATHLKVLSLKILFPGSQLCCHQHWQNQRRPLQSLGKQVSHQETQGSWTVATLGIVKQSMPTGTSLLWAAAAAKNLMATWLIL